MVISIPDYHFLVLAPGLSSDWVFVAARRYYLRYRPIVLDNLDLVQYTPARRKVAITTLARRDTAKLMRDQVARRYPKAFHDPLVYDVLNEMQITLDGRASLGQRFGVPEGQP